MADEPFIPDSSNIPYRGLTFFRNFIGITGPTGNQGPQGPAGACGPSIVGPTGPTGATLVNIIKLSDNYFEFFYSDNTSKLSQSEIVGISGYSKISLEGISLASFSVLSNSLIDQTYDGDFPVDILTFKGISSNYENILRIYYDNTSNPPETVVVDYSAVNLGFIGISGGTLGNLLYNRTGQKQYGITASFYDDYEKAVLVQNKNIQEGLVIANPTIFSNSLACYKINPDDGSVFYISPYTQNLSTNNGINGFAFLIKKPELTTHSSGLSLHIPNGFTYGGNIYYATYEDESDISNGITFASNFFERFDLSGIVWQNDSYFCPAKQKFNVINMISLGGRYFAIPAQYDSAQADITSTHDTIPTTCYPFEDEIDVNASVNFAEGLCCPVSCFGSVSESFKSNCPGYFYYGKTLGDSSLCSSQGFCCFYNGNASADLTFCQCKAIDPNAIWHPYRGIVTNSSFFQCSQTVVEQEQGAYCTGVNQTGGITSKSNAILNQWYFHGTCTKNFGTDNGQLAYICQDGYGACCDKGITCENNVIYSDCFADNKSYSGANLTCQEINCSPDNIPCFQGVPGIGELKQGDEFAGGVVAGFFDFSNIVSGHKVFDNFNYDVNLFGKPPADLTNSYNNIFLNASGFYKRNYRSLKDYSGYGVNAYPESNICGNSDTFIIIVAKEDIEINGNKNFIWSKNNLSWGPLYDPITLTKDTEDILTKTYADEGYIFENNSTISVASYASLYSNSFRSCATVRTINDYAIWIYNAPKQSINGSWTRNYGLYNTGRLCGARISSFDPAYAPDPIYANSTSLADAITKFNIDNPPTSDIESSWFVPSHDEMGFLFNLVLTDTDFNLNSSLLLSGFEPIIGSYWTSTGSFDLALLNGFATSTTIGTRAWAYDLFTTPFGSSTYSFDVAYTRTSERKIRPIKLIRCDGRHPLPGSNNYKFWRFPIINI